VAFRYVRYAPNSDQILRRSEMPLWANSRLVQSSNPEADNLQRRAASRRPALGESQTRRQSGNGDLQHLREMIFRSA
jgi:hypothetical protein